MYVSSEWLSKMRKREVAGSSDGGVNVDGGFGEKGWIVQRRMKLT